MNNEKKIVVIRDKKFRRIISAGEIQRIIVAMAQKIDKDFRLKDPVLVPVLNGSFLFAADLARNLNLDCELTFIKKSSYTGMRARRRVDGLIGLGQSIKGRHVIVLEDIVDSGNTLSAVLKDLRRLKPASIRVAALLFKPGAYKKREKIHYVGKRIPNDFVVGYGLDYNGRGRNLRSIYMLDLQ